MSTTQDSSCFHFCSSGSKQSFPRPPLFILSLEVDETKIMPLVTWLKCWQQIIKATSSLSSASITCAHHRGNLTPTLVTRLLVFARHVISSSRSFILSCLELYNLYDCLWSVQSLYSFKPRPPCHCWPHPTNNQSDHRSRPLLRLL